MAIQAGQSPTPDWLTSIAREIRFRFQPKPGYYDYVQRVFFNSNPELEGVDPFDIEIPQFSPRRLYFNRVEVSRTIDVRGSKIILGKTGSGKTMLFSTRNKQEGQLLVQISMSHIRDLSAFQHETLNDRTPLNTWILCYLIFNDFWNDFFNTPAKQPYLKVMRTKETWMETLRWFFHHFPPMPLQPVEYLDFELKAWLQGAPGQDERKSTVMPDRLLFKLIQFITMPIEHPDHGEAYYRHVSVLIDDVDSLSAAAQKAFEENVHHILDLKLPNFEIKAFINDSGEALFPHQDKFISYPNNLSFYTLPPWSKSDLINLLLTRLSACDPTFSSSPPGNRPDGVENQLGGLNLGPIIAHEAQKEFFDILAEGAARSDALKDPWDAPIHWLRLARGCLALAAGQWALPQDKKNLGSTDLTNLVEAYWKIGEEKYA